MQHIPIHCLLCQSSNGEITLSPSIVYCLLSIVLIHRIAYGSKAHLLNMFFYLLSLLPLTHLIVSLKPTLNITATGEHNIAMVPVSFIEVLMTVIIIKESLC